MNIKRMRGRNQHRTGGGGGGGPGRPQTGGIPMNRNHVFDSSGPEMRVRGTAQQLFEKYLQLGRDATGSGDRVMAEGYFQHAEHYFRIINAMNQAAQQHGGPNGGPGQPNGGQPYQHNGPARRADDGGEIQDGDEPDDQPQPGFYRDPRDQPEPPRPPSTPSDVSRDIPIGSIPPDP